MAVQRIRLETVAGLRTSTELPMSQVARKTRTSVASAGEIFDAPDFLHALSAHISLQLPTQQHVSGFGHEATL